MAKRDYSKERIEKRYSVLTANCEPVGIWGNLKKLCEEMREQDTDFLSYSAVSKRRATENPIKFSTPKGEYQIFIGNLK